MNREKLNSLEIILKQEKVGNLVKLNYLSSLKIYLNDIEESYFASHKKNKIIYSGINGIRGFKDKYKDKVFKSLNIFFINDPSSISKEEVVRNVKSKINEKDGLIIIDLNDKRDKKWVSDSTLYGYWIINDLLANFSFYMPYIFRLITDIFSQIIINTKNSIYENEIIVNTMSYDFFNKDVKKSFSDSQDKNIDWERTRTVLNNKFSKIDSIKSDPLDYGSLFKTLTDEFFLLLKVIVFEKYINFLDYQSIQSQNRIEAIEEEILNVKDQIAKDEDDEELNEMNDILNSKIKDRGNYEN